MPITKEERIARKQQHTKQERISVLDGIPSPDEVREGVPVLRDTNEGLIEYVKHKGVLHATPKGVSSGSTTVSGATTVRGSGVDGAPPSSGFRGDHGDLTGLSDDDHLIYILADGTRALTADWNVGSFDITAVDLNATGNLDVDGITNLDSVDIDGTVQIDNTVTVGVDDTGYDVKFFGATAGKFMLWDESADTLVVNSQIDFVSQGSGESVSGDGTDVNINASTAINLVANNIDIGKNASADIVMNFLATNNGVYRWMRSEDYFKFSDDIRIEGNEKLYLNSTSAWIYSENGGYIGIHPKLHVAPTGTSPYVTNYAVNIEPQTSGRHLTSGEADYTENYSWLSLYLLQSDTTTYDDSFGVWA